MGTPYDTSDAAFGQALRNIAPLSPDQIERARRRVDEVDRASGKPLAPVTPVTRSIAVSLKSGEMPPSVKVAPGWISTITFSDISGAPWPVLAVTNGNPSAYDVKSSGPEGNTNIITISAKQGYIPSNIAITLVGAKVPILMTLDPMGSQVDYRVDAQIDSRGPNAMLDVVSGTALQPTGDSVMLAFLDGVPPNGAKAKKTGSRDVQAWGFNDQLYVRTSQTLLSPAYISKQTNVSGVNVYVLGEAPVLVVSSGGRMGTVQVGR
jgi:intracellular multiplication protein IcmK